MSKISKKLEKYPSNVKNDELLDYIISFQLKKIESYNIQTKDILDEKSEKAMSNLIELLKLRI